jgi:hypothetical protein
MLRMPPEPPVSEISQASFREETRRTETTQSVQQFQRTKYISAKTKINSGSLATGGIIGGTWFLGIPLTFSGSSDVVANIALFGGIAIGAATYFGIILRARHTGMYEQ